MPKLGRNFSAATAGRASIESSHASVESRRASIESSQASIDSSSASIESAKREILKTVAYTLLRQVYGVTAPPKVDVRQGVDFYAEVRRFEISLLQQALFYTNGKQTAAAALLNLNVTTLHSKIKFYGIEMAAIKISASSRRHELVPEIFFRQKPKLVAAASNSNGTKRFGSRPKRDAAGEDDTASDLETLKTEVLKSMALALECKAEDPTGFLDFDLKLGLNFYEEVTNFEMRLLQQALMFTNGNQRAAAQLLCLKTSTLNTKLKMYRIDSASNQE
jgi:DNA-binding protein Fis